MSVAGHNRFVVLTLLGAEHSKELTVRHALSTAAAKAKTWGWGNGAGQRRTPREWTVLLVIKSF